MDMADLDHIGEQTVVEHFKALLDAVGDDEDGLIIDRDGEPLAALIPAALYDELASDRDNRLWQILKKRDPRRVRPVTKVLDSIRSQRTR